MSTLHERVEDFLNQKCIAVAGVSRSKTQAANIVYRKLRNAGYRVLPINPRASKLEGDTCYPDLESAPDRIDGVVIVTPPDVTEQVVRDCVQTGIPRIWMHRSLGCGSVSDSAVKLSQEHNLSVISGGCPMMFCEPVDVAHKCLRWFLARTGRLPN
jgi:predicted CoA-binding protein